MDDRIKADEKITISEVTGGNDRDRNDLMGCYFQQSGGPGTYQFYSQHGEHIQTAPEVLRGTTRSFIFVYGGFLWHVLNFQLMFLTPISTAKGDWVNDDRSRSEEEGHFQAQAGGGAGADEGATYATA